MAKRIAGFFSCKRRFLRCVLMLSAGVFAGGMECYSMPAVFCFFSMLPLFTAMKCESRRELVLKLAPFLFAYDIMKTSFLLTVCGIFGMIRITGVLCSVAAVLLSAMIPLVSQTICLSFFINIRTGKPRDAASLSLLFAASEWLCENIGPLSFPWLGVWAQAERAQPVLMTAKLFGCRFTSFIILMINGLVYLIIIAVRSGGIRPLANRLAALAALVGFSMLYGYQETAALKTACEYADTLDVMTVQLDCEGREKSKMSPVQAADEYLDLIKSGYTQSTDMIFLPETAVHTVYESGAKAFAKLEGFAEESGCVVVTGCFYKTTGGKFNTVAVLTPEGAAECMYFKTHLVPFGEYMPFSGIFGKSRLAANCAECRPLEVSGVKIGCGICIESIYSDIFLSQTRCGAQLLYIPTNDSWFGDSFARRAHYLHAKMRAIENSRFTVRAGNCGISAVITPWGEETAKDESKEKGFLTSQVRLMDEKSVYTTVGDIFILAPLSLVTLSAVKGAKARIRNRTQA